MADRVSLDGHCCLLLFSAVLCLECYSYFCDSQTPIELRLPLAVTARGTLTSGHQKAFINMLNMRMGGG